MLETSTAFCLLYYNYLFTKLHLLFSVKKLENLDFNMLLMSPPCQPFTRVGKKKDKDDPRTKYTLNYFLQ